MRAARRDQEFVDTDGETIILLVHLDGLLAQLGVTQKLRIAGVTGKCVAVHQINAGLVSGIVGVADAEIDDIVIALGHFVRPAQRRDGVFPVFLC